jgi:DNA-binding NtrC family response regulator
MDWIVVETFTEGEDGHEHIELDALPYDPASVPLLMRSVSVGLLIIIRADTKEEAIEFVDERLHPDKYDCLIDDLPAAPTKACTVDDTVTTIEEAMQLAAREVVQRTIHRNRGKIAKAARELNISRSTIYRMFDDAECLRGQVAES